MSDHELRLLPLPFDGVWLPIMPYCPCGWVGDYQNAEHASALTAYYEAHLKGVR